MENEHELSYETLTRVYLESYEHYKGVVAGLEHSKPGFELQGSKMVEMGLEGDEEGLVDVLVKLETSLDEVITPCDAATYTRRNKKIQVQATQEIEDTHVTLTPINLDGQQQSSFVSSGFVSNMLNPNQDTGVDAIFRQHAEAIALIDIPVTSIAEPSFFAPTNRPPTPNPLFIQLQQPPILTLTTTPSSLLQNLPDFALSSIPGIVDQYLANKIQEAVDVAVQLKYDRIREEANTKNQQFLDSIDEGMKKVIKEQVKKEVSKITPKIEKLVNEQLES
ncbi:hypothetical protein Tco_1538984 [Tanacetum coccineum]